jgi:hypothetical protein
MPDFCPYKGLQPYTAADRAFFFGRERDREIIISNLYASPLTILYGTSGVGKSSVLLAGVLPELQREPRVAVVVFRNWQEMDFALMLKREVRHAVSMARAGREVGVNFALPLDEFLWNGARALRGHLFIIFDQFEEYFLYHGSSPAADRFDAEFARAVNRKDIEANFLISIREDGLSKLDRFKGRIPNLTSNMLRLEHLDREAAESVIHKPLLEYNMRVVATRAQLAQSPTATLTSHEQLFLGASEMRVEDALVQEIIQQVQTGRVTLGLTGEGGKQAQSQLKMTPSRVGDLTPMPGHDDTSTRQYSADVSIETPYLQLVLLRLWIEERKASSNLLRLATFLQLGGAERIVRTHLDTTMSALGRSERLIAAQAFRFLVTPSGTKIAYTPSDLASYARIPRARLAPVLQKLAGPEMRVLRSLSALDDEQEPRYEIFHDVLAMAALDWRARFLRQHGMRQRAALVALGGFIILSVILGQFFYARTLAQEKDAAQAQAQVASTVVKAAEDLIQTAAPAAVPARETIAALATQVVIVPTMTPASGGAPQPSATPTQTPQPTPTRAPPTPSPTPTPSPLPSATATPTPTPTPRPTITPTRPVVIAPPANTQIVFTSNRDNVQRIYRMDWNGRNQQLIPYDIDGSVGEMLSSYSAARNALVFAALVRLPGGGRQQDIFSSTWLSVDFRQLTGRQFNNWHPVWSPNGQRIAFVSSRDGGSGQLYVMNADGGAQRRIIRSNALDDEPAWSPDNRTLVFSSTRAGGQARQLYRVDVETGAVVTLTRGLVRDTHPWWSADGRTIVFARVTDKNGNGRLEDDEANIWRMSADGGEPHNLTNSQTNEGDPALSPDGSWIVFTRYMGGRTRNDIFTMTVNGDQPTQLTTTEGDDGEPSWVWPR